MDLVSEDLENKEIARRRRLREQAVKNHLQHSFEKLSFSTATTSNAIPERQSGGNQG